MKFFTGKGNLYVGASGLVAVVLLVVGALDYIDERAEKRLDNHLGEIKLLISEESADLRERLARIEARLNGIEKER